MPTLHHGHSTSVQADPEAAHRKPSPSPAPPRLPAWPACRARFKRAEFVPFLSFDAEVRRVICTTNAIESVNARIRKAVRARGHFPSEQAALKCVYMAIMSLSATGENWFWITFRARATERHQSRDHDRS